MSETQSETRWRLVVLAGGDSAEREVSLRSGAAVAGALLMAGHDVSLVDPSEHPVKTFDWTGVDACFVALHGGAGEDGRIQEELEALGVPHTGSNPQACRLAMSKSASKQRFFDCDVPTCPFVLVEANDTITRTLTRVAPLAFPLIVKPDSQGSSIGISVVEAPAQLAAAIDLARLDDPRTLIEPFVRGREFTVAVLDDCPLPLIEIVKPEAFFSYEAKYASPRTEYCFDFTLPYGSRGAISDAAVAAARALGTESLVRVDLMLADDGGLFVLEVNTIPGLTARSLAPRAAARAGLNMAALCEQMIRQCLTPAEVT